MSYRMNYRSPNLDDIRAWLSQHGGHSDFTHPSGMRQPLSLGCSVMDWWGRRITLVSYQLGRNLPRDKAHLVIIKSTDLPDPPVRGQPRFSESGDWAIGAWNDGNLTYFLMSPADRRVIGKYL